MEHSEDVLRAINGVSFYAVAIAEGRRDLLQTVLDGVTIDCFGTVRIGSLVAPQQ